MTISAVLIVKNEEKTLEKCLKSLDGVDEIIICDTGSKDKTLEVAKKFTDKIFFREWNDSFCEARNFAKSHATGDWIISIDADEVLQEIGPVREAIARAEKDNNLAIDVLMVAEDRSKQSFRFPRLFKNSPECYWVGDVHNHLSVQGSFLSDVKITFGYSPAHDLDPDRAMRILEKSVERDNGPREMFYLGREYYYRRRYEDSIRMLGKYVQESRYLSEKAEAFLIMARSYWALKRGDDARDACAQCLIINANFKEAILLMAELSWPHNAEQWKRMAETANNRDVLFVRETI